MAEFQSTLMQTKRDLLFTDKIKKIDQSWMNTSIDDIEMIRKMYSTKTIVTEESEFGDS
jgi:hypothetical protein